MEIMRNSELMDKVIVYGIGGTYRELKNDLPDNIEIIAYADSDRGKSTSVTGELFEGHSVLSKEELLKTEFDYIYICTTYNNAWDITQDLVSLGIEKQKIRYLYRKYYDSEWNYELDNAGNTIHHVAGLNILERKGDKSDFQTISELLCTNCYSLDFLHDNTVVIDAGMNIGLASLLFAKNEKVKKVYSYEPFKDTFDAAVRNISMNPEIQDKIKPYNFALYNCNEDKEIRVLSDFAGGRTTEFELIENVDDRGERKEYIRYRKASDIISAIIEENAESDIVCKIDTEGAEFSIFEDLEKAKIFGRISSIMMEYHRNPKPLINTLNNYGFICVQNGHKNLGMIYAINMKIRE